MPASTFNWRNDSARASDWLPVVWLVASLVLLLLMLAWALQSDEQPPPAPEQDALQRTQLQQKALPTVASDASGSDAGGGVSDQQGSLAAVSSSTSVQAAGTPAPPPQEPSIQSPITQAAASDLSPTDQTDHPQTIEPIDSAIAGSGLKEDEPAGPMGRGGVFEGTARQRHFVYVVDCSGSMHGSRLMAAKEELLQTINRLPSDATFYVIFYNQSFQPMPASHRVPATPPEKAKASRWIKDVDAFGQTNPLPAMRQALSLKPDAVFLLSDGDFESAMANEIRIMNRGDRRAAIFTVGFGSRTESSVLEQIARQNGGDYRQFRRSGH